MIKYILTNKSFFKEGPCGRVSHAKGFVEGLSENEVYVTLVCHLGADNYIASNPYIIIKSTDSFFSILCLKEVLESIVKKEKIVIRWRPILPYIIFPLALTYKNIYFEVNSITGLESKNKLIRSLVRISIYLTTKLTNIIVVSEHSKRLILSISHNPKSIYVMPNGFDEKELANFKPTYSQGAKINLIYFGRKQEYYEWNNLYNICKDQSNLNLHIFGFSDIVDANNIFFHGQFTHKSLINSLNNITNPALIIHPDNSETAKSGSPMKLFEYAFLSIPVIAGDSIAEICRNFPEFIIYNSGNKQDLRKKIEYLVTNYHHLLDSFYDLNQKAKSKFTWKGIITSWIEKEGI